MTYRMTSVLILAGGIVLAINVKAAAQGPPSLGVNGSGTPGTVPLWTGSGRTLTNSHIQDNGSVVNASLPLQASGSGNGPAVAGSGTNGTGVSGSSSNNNGVTGFTSGTSGWAGVAGFGVQYGVLGFASATDVGWGVKGVADGTAVGVEGISPFGAGIRGNALDKNNNPTAGDAGQFVAGAGGILLHGFLSNFNGPGGWDEKFKVDAAGNLYTYGNAYKPGGGSWSTLSDVRAKKSIQPISGALNQLLKLRGVTYEYTNPSAFGESGGTHIGMVAQDVEQVYPSWVDTGTDGYKRLTFRGFEAVTVEAVRELDTNSKEAIARIADLERQNEELRRAIEVLTEAVRTLQQK